MMENYIKGITVDFSDKLDSMSEEEIEYVQNKADNGSIFAKEILAKKQPLKEFDREHGYHVDQFCEHDDIFERFRDAGITHMFIHFWFKIDWRRDLELDKPTHICLADATSPEYKGEFDYSVLFKKCVKYGITPVVKIMNDHLLDNDTVKPNKPDEFFKEYRELTEKILSYDKNHDIGIITIANETALIRNYTNCRNYFEDYITWLRKNYSYLKISMSQFAGDIRTGQLDIVDLVDIIGVNYYPGCRCHNSKSYQDLINYIYTNDIYVIQEYCKNNNKTFMITECGCSNWNEQYIEPERGNSMVDFYNKKYNARDQMIYLQAAMTVFKDMDYCSGFVLHGFGGNYDPFFKHEYFYPLKNKKLSVKTKEDTFEMIKNIWEGVRNENCIIIVES